MNRAMPAGIFGLIGLVACAVALGTSTPTGAAVPAGPGGPPPSAAEFGLTLAASANRYGAAHGDPARLVHTDCVQVSRGHYMCSYAVIRPGVAECHLIQARWTPSGPSSFTVTLAGRVRQCGSLREALRSLSDPASAVTPAELRPSPQGRLNMRAAPHLQLPRRGASA